jgi:hypothetical protein
MTGGGNWRLQFPFSRSSPRGFGMKSMRSLIALVVSVAAVSLSGQTAQPNLPPGTVDFIMVSREAHFDQTDATTLTPSAAAPFRFAVSVEGTNMTNSSPLTAASFTWPRNSSISLAFDPWDNDWSYEDTNFASMAALNTAYGTGTYSITMTGTPATTLDITVGSFDSSILQVPMLTLTGGTWMGNAYVLGAADSLTITFNSVYSGTASSTQGFHYDGWIEGGLDSQGVDGFVNFDPRTQSAVTGGATPEPWVVGVMPVGTYSVEIGYTEIQNPLLQLEGTIFSASLLEYRTSVQLVVVPEPSTYALCALGLGVLGLAHWRRRRA